MPCQGRPGFWLQSLRQYDCCRGAHRLRLRRAVWAHDPVRRGLAFYMATLTWMLCGARRRLHFDLLRGSPLSASCTTRKTWPAATTWTTPL